LSFHLADSTHVISVEVGDPNEMTREVNTFFLAVNSKSIKFHRGRDMIIRHSGGNDGNTFFPGNDENFLFSKMIEFSVTTDYDDDSLFFLNNGIQ
jgi:hypothetical protein